MLRVRSVGVCVFLSFSIPHTQITPSISLPSLRDSQLGTGGKISEGYRLAFVVVTDRHICTGMKGDGLRGRNGQLSTWGRREKTKLNLRPTAYRSWQRKPAERSAGLVFTPRVPE